MLKVKLLSLDEINVRVYKIAKYLKENNYDVEILLLDRKTITNQKVSSEIINEIEVKRFYCRRKNTDSVNKFYKKIIYFFWFLNFIINVKTYLKNVECDYLICQANIGTFAGILAKKGNTKIIYDMREFYEGRGKKISKPLLIFNHFLVNKSDFILYINDKMIEKINKKQTKKLVYLPNYVDKNHYKNISKTKNKLLRIGYIGCPRDTKSLTNLVFACKNNKNVEVFIHGMGSSYDTLKKLEKEINNLYVTGEYDGLKDSEKLFQNVDVLFCGYDIENINWKNAIAVKFFEAIISLTPVIVFENSKMGELAKQYNIGFLIPNNDAKSFKNVINKITKKEVKCKIKNLEKIQYNYVWDDVIKNLERILQ